MSYSSDSTLCLLLDEYMIGKLATKLVSIINSLVGKNMIVGLLAKKCNNIRKEKKFGQKIVSCVKE
jgi:hypothetical protein